MYQFISILILMILAVGCAAQINQGEQDFLWLENLTSARSLEWVKKQNIKTTNLLGSSQRFKSMKKSILDRSNKKEQLEMLFFVGDEIARIRKNSDTSKGILQSITLEESTKKTPQWKEIINFDVLNRSESKAFVYGNSRCNLAKIKQCLIGLSINGADNVDYREYDLTKREFNKNGFVIPNGDTFMAWLNKDTILFTSTFEGETVSEAGYGTTAKLWKRGTPIKQAKEILHVTKGTGLGIEQYLWKEESYIFLSHWLDFNNEILYFYKDNNLTKINIPTSFEFYGVHKGFVVVKLFQDWEVNQQNFPTGSLVGIDLESTDFNKPKLELIFEQTERKSFDYVNLTKSKILLNVIEDLKTHPLVIEKVGGSTPNNVWRKEYIKKPSNDVLSIRDTSIVSDEVIVAYRGFLTPNSLYFLNTVSKKHRFWAASPKEFDTSNLAFSYHFAKGKDGVKIPYQMVAPKNFDPNKRYPTMVYVYAAYGDTRTAWYSSNLGKEWLEKGGVVVIANARGGGAYGEKWHQAAVRTTKHLTTDDVATVARDLIERKITTNKKIGVYGGSIGGLTACSVITTYPDLFNAARCKSPITDMMRYTKLFDGSSWISELGDPNLPEERKYLLNHSPYHAVKKGANIPPILFITYANDDRVHPGHSRRMVAKMEEQGLKAYLYESPEGGHNGATTKSEKAKIQALVFEYFKQRLFD